MDSKLTMALRKQLFNHSSKMIILPVEFQPSNKLIRWNVLLLELLKMESARLKLLIRSLKALLYFQEKNYNLGVFQHNCNAAIEVKMIKLRSNLNCCRACKNLQKQKGDTKILYMWLLYDIWKSNLQLLTRLFQIFWMFQTIH